MSASGNSLVASSSGGGSRYRAETDLLADLLNGNLGLEELNYLGHVGGHERLAFAGEGTEDTAGLIQLGDDLGLGRIGLELLLSLQQI